MTPISEEEEELGHSITIKVNNNYKANRDLGGLLDLISPSIRSGSNAELISSRDNSNLITPIAVGSETNLVEVEKEKFEVKKQTASKKQFRKV